MDPSTSKAWTLMVNVWIDAMVVTVLWILLSGRTRVVGDAYAHGYRQGREDANRALRDCALLAQQMDDEEVGSSRPDRW